jgi:hypothetical protein
MFGVQAAHATRRLESTGSPNETPNSSKSSFRARMSVRSVCRAAHARAGAGKSTVITLAGIRHLPSWPLHLTYGLAGRAGQRVS